MATSGAAYMQVPKTTHITPTMSDLFSWDLAPMRTPITTATMNRISTVTNFRTLR